MFVVMRSRLVCHRRCGIVYRFHLQGSKYPIITKKEERRSELRHGYRLKSRITPEFEFFTTNIR